MKATGIVRRIDDLGRVTIPKEVRRALNITEGDPLELYTTNQGEVVFRKYDTRPELVQTLNTLEQQMRDPDVVSCLDADSAEVLVMLVKMSKKLIKEIK